ncbi:hypothetical protein MMC22_009673 [Lobaria immixta]|nr:hypothetical protein [Lobaria immixta]
MSTPEPSTKFNALGFSTLTVICGIGKPSSAVFAISVDSASSVSKDQGRTNIAHALNQSSPGLKASLDLQSVIGNLGFSLDAQINAQVLFLNSFVGGHANDASKFQAHSWLPTFQLSVFQPWKEFSPKPSFDPDHCFGGHGLHLQRLSRPVVGQACQVRGQVVDAGKGPAVQLSDDLFADLAVAEGVPNVIRAAGGAGVDLELDRQHDGLRFIRSIPGIGADHGGQLQIAQVNGVELTRERDGIGSMVMEVSKSGMAGENWFESLY